MLRIENCLQLATKNNMLFVRGSSLFQGAIDEICFAKFSVETNTLDLFYSELQIQVPLPQGTAVEQITNLFPSTFFRLNSTNEFQFLNIKQLSFVNLSGTNLNLRFKNGFFTITLNDTDPITIFKQITNLFEVIH